MNMNTKSAASALLFAVLSAASLQASASTSFSLSSCNLSFGPFAGIASVSGFDEAVCNFAPTNTSSLSVSNMGAGMIDPSFHGPYGVAIDLWNGAAWVNVFTSPTYAVDTGLSSILGGTISYSAMTANQLRLRSDVDHSWNFHDLRGDMLFTVTSVPEPETYALMLAGLGLIGLIGRRTKGGKGQDPTTGLAA